MKQRFIDRFARLNDIDRVDDQALKVQRGIKFEELINDVFTEEQTLIKRGYHTKDGSSEQVDGAIEIWNRVLLLEVKWVSSNLAASDLFAFIGKIENKFQGTLGVFISRKQLSENFIAALSRGRRQSVIVFHGKDLDLLFQPNNPPLSDYLLHCLKLFSFDNVVHYPFQDYIDTINAQKVSETSGQNGAGAFISEYLNKSVDLSAEEISEAYDTLGKQAKEEVFQYAMAYYRIVLAPHYSKRHTFAPHNYQNYFRLLDATDAEIDNTEADYFLDRLPTHVSIYGRPELTRLYLPRYEKLSIADRERFEQVLVKKLAEAYTLNDFTAVDTISAIADKLWFQLRNDTIDKLKDQYMHIASASFGVERTFNIFADKLLKDGRISSSELEDWLLDRLFRYSDAFSDKADLMYQFMLSFSNLHTYMGMDVETFRTYFTDRASDIITIT